MLARNMKLSAKIYLGFGVVLVLLVVIALAAWTALQTASHGFVDYRNMARDNNLAGLLESDMMKAQMSVKDFLIAGSEKSLSEYAEYARQMREFLKQAKQEINQPERLKIINRVDEEFRTYDQAFAKVVALRKDRDLKEKEILNVKGSEMEKTLTEILQTAASDNNMGTANVAGLAMRELLLAQIYVVKYMSANEPSALERVNKELDAFKESQNRLAMGLQTSELRALLESVKQNSALYEKTFAEVVELITQRNAIIADTLERIGPMVAQDIKEVKLSIKAEQDKLGPELQASNARSLGIIAIVGAIAVVLGILLAYLMARIITKPINRAIDGLSASSDQVAAASDQVANSGQSMAQGAAEQAASLEETSASTEEMSSMTQRNAENAGQADAMMAEAARIIEDANQAMGELSQAMAKINKMSGETAKIVKTIDEIAFQTNLLALNAAVEAARAGEAGAGFAVVADEVRNLAMRAAEAAKNTGSLIETNITDIKSGAALVAKTDEAFKKVRESAGKVAELVTEIAHASTEQNQGIHQINQALTEMDKVTQQNAANAEESAAAAEELTAQAATVAEFVRDLVIVVGGRNSARQAAGRGPAKRLLAYSGAKKPTPKAASQGKPAKAKTEPKPQNLIPLDKEEEFQDF